MTKKRSEVPQMRGVEAFLSEPKNSLSIPNSMIPIDKIRLPKRQPRRYLDPGKLEQLIQSIKEYGILEPLLVRSQGETYELIAGERRYRAAQALELIEVPVTVREFNDKEALQVALVENLQREDLNPLEETEGILDLLALELTSSREDVISLLNRVANAKKRGQELTENVSRQLEQVERIFTVVGRLTPESFRTARLPLLNLPDEILEVLRQGKIAYTKAQAIARVEEANKRQALLSEAISENLSLNQIRERIQVLLQKLEPDAFSRSEQAKANIQAVTRRLTQSKAWEDPKKWKQIQTLLQKLEELLEAK